MDKQACSDGSFAIVWELCGPSMVQTVQGWDGEDELRAPVHLSFIISKNFLSTLGLAVSSLEMWMPPFCLVRSREPGGRRLILQRIYFYVCLPVACLSLMRRIARLRIEKYFVKLGALQIEGIVLMEICYIVLNNNIRRPAMYIKLSRALFPKWDW